MDTTILDFVLINITSYLLGISTGLIICCKYKDKIMMRSKSLDDIATGRQYNPQADVIQASAPPSNPVKLTIE